MKLFDSHLHLTDDAFAEDRAEVLARARESGVCAMVTVASNPEDARAGLTLARSEPDVWSTAGLHPHEARDWAPALMDEIRSLALETDVVAIGETGLDFYYDNSPRVEQTTSFEAHLALAAELGLPAIVHSRSADGETADLIRSWAGRLTGVLHCFSGGRDLLDVGLDAGWYVSFSGIVTFRTYEDADLVRRVPLERLLVETDSPYLAPVPRRGRRNEPAFVEHTCRVVAEHRGESAEVVAAATFRNACALYRVSEGK